MFAQRKTLAPRPGAEYNNILKTGETDSIVEKLIG